MGAYEDVLAKIGSSGPSQVTPVQVQTNAAPSTFAQQGYQGPQITAPAPSTGSKIQSAINYLDPKSDQGRQHLLGIGKSVGGWIYSSVRNANDFAHLVNDQNLTNPVNIYHKIMNTKDAVTVTDRANSTINNAQQQYADGVMTKQQRDEIVKQAGNEVKRAGANIVSTEVPLTLQDTINIIDGAITTATLGTYTAAKLGAVKAGDLAIKGTSDFLLNRMAQATEVAGSKGISATTGQRIIMNAAPTTAEKMMATAEQFITHTPALNRNYERILRDIGTSANAKGFAKNVLVQLAITSPMRRETMRMTAQMVEDARQGNYFMDGNKIGAVPQALLLAGMALEGGPIGFITKNFAKAGKSLKTAMYGETTFFDSLQKSLADRGMQGNLIDGINKYLARAPKDTQKDAQIILKQFVGTNLQRGAAGKTADAVAEYIARTADESGIAIEKLTPEQIIANIMEHTQAQNLLQDFNASGLNVVATKYDQGTQNRLTNLITKALGKDAASNKALPTADDKIARAKEVAKAVIDAEVKKNPYWAQNQDVVNGIYDAIDNAKSFEFIKGAPGAINANKIAKGIPKTILNKLKASGYIATVSESPTYVPQISRDVAKGVELKSKFVPVNDALFEQAAISKPYFRAVGAGLTKIGLGLDESAAIAYRMVRDNASQSIEKETGLQGRKVLNALQQWAETGSDSRFADLVPGNWKNVTKRVTTDMRMMYVRQIKEALAAADIKVTNEQAKAIKLAIREAHTRVPLQTLGLADKLTSQAYRHIPFYSLYAKAQGAFRYTYNPFFNVQEQTETALLSQALTPGKLPWVAGMGTIFPGTKRELNSIITKLDKAGFFNNSTLISNDINKSLMATRFGEGAQDVYLGRVSAQITESQKRAIAGSVKAIADKMGMTVEDALASNGAMIEDIIRPIVQYPTHGALNSNLAKAMNIAVFPSRYNLKVTALAVKALGEAPPAVQLLTINKLWQMENWLKSPEGLAWQQEHAAAVAMFKWLTPIGNIQWVFDTLGAAADIAGKPFGKTPTSNTSSIGDLGVIGGLPFGVIGQILQNQGLFSLNTPYVNPKDGAIYAKKIPESMKARTAQALMDLIGSTFTYPGASIGLNQLGLPSKSKVLQTGASFALGKTQSSEWNTKQYAPMDLSQQDRIKQEIWAQQYSVKKGIKKPDTSNLPVPATSPLQPKIVPGKVLTKTEARALTKSQAAAKKAKKSKTTTFPSRLPQ